MEGALGQTSMPEHLSNSAFASHVAPGHLHIDNPQSVVDFLARSWNNLTGPDFDLPSQKIESVPMLLDANETVPREFSWSINALDESVPGGEQMVGIPEQSVSSAESLLSNPEVQDIYEVIPEYYGNPVFLNPSDFDLDRVMNLDVPQLDLPGWSQFSEPSSSNGKRVTIDNGLDQLIPEELMSTDSAGGAQLIPGGEHMQVVIPAQSVSSAESVHSNPEVQDSYDIFSEYSSGAEYVYGDAVFLNPSDFDRDRVMNLDVPQLDLPEWSQFSKPSSNNGERVTIENGSDQLVPEELMSTHFAEGVELGSGSSDDGPAGTLLESSGASKIPAGIGVTYHTTNKKYEAHLWLPGRQLRNMRKKKGVQLYLGHFATAQEAKRAHDMAALKIRRTGRGRRQVYPLNFPASDYTNYLAEHSGWSERDFFWKIRRSSLKFSKGRSSMKGVTVRTSTRKGVETVAFEAKISYKVDGEISKSFKLGMFESEEAAGKAYDLGQLYLHGPDELTTITNFLSSDYSQADIQEIGMLIRSQCT